MSSILSGADIRSARSTASMTQAELGAILGLKQPNIAALERKPALSADMQSRLAAVFPTYQPAAPAPIGLPSGSDTRAVAYRALLAAAAALYATPASLPPAAPAATLTPEAKAPKKAEAKRLEKRAYYVVQRNAQRDADRPHVQALHARLKPLATSQNWDAYRAAVLEAHKACHMAQEYLDAYCAVAIGQVVDDADPLVTLPLES